MAISLAYPSGGVFYLFKCFLPAFAAHRGGGGGVGVSTLLCSTHSTYLLDGAPVLECWLVQGLEEGYRFEPGTLSRRSSDIDMPNSDLATQHFVVAISSTLQYLYTRTYNAPHVALYAALYDVTPRQKW